MHIQLQVSGYSYMMWSRWQLLSNFKQSHNIKDNLVNKKMFLTEPKRDNKFIIYENNNGTNIMTDYNLCLLDKLQNLYDNKLDTIRIDSFLHNEKWINDNAEIYLKAIELLKTNKYDTSFIDYAKKRLIKYDKIQSNGFFDMDKKDLIYLSKIEE
jgi:putative protease